MKHQTSLWLGAALLVGLIPGASAQVENRFSLQPRVGFNTHVRFLGDLTLPAPAPARTAPGGEKYNYDDGYVLTDVSGNFGDQTWHWGYDNSASQVSGNNILMSRTLSTGPTPTVTADDQQSWGGELVYDLLIPYREGGFQVGLQVAGNYQYLDARSQSSAVAGVQRMVYPFPFTPGTTPPTATPSQPYQGTYDGPGFTIGATPGTPYLAYDQAGAIVTGNRKFEANLWGMRLGPSVEVPVVDKLTANFSFGAAMGYLDADVSWTEAVQMASGARGALKSGAHDSSLLLGVYGGITLHYKLVDNLDLNLGAYYQHLEDYKHDFGGRTVQLDMGDSVFLNFGLGFSF